MYASLLSGKRIKELRIEQGLTQKALGQKIGLSQQAVNLLEHGKRRIDLGLYDKLAEALDPDKTRLVRLSFLSMEAKQKLDEEIEVFDEYFDTFMGDVYKEPKKEILLAKNFRMLNDEGQDKVLEYTADLAENPKYQKKTK